jgi:hypothetical protein
MTIGEQAAKSYEDSEPGGFAAALLRCFLFGLVIKRPNFVLLAEPVCSDGKQVVGIGSTQSNCWFVYYFATTETFSATDPMDEAPYPLAYVAYKRKGRIKVHPWERMQRMNIERQG